MKQIEITLIETALREAVNETPTTWDTGEDIDIVEAFENGFDSALRAVARALAEFGVDEIEFANRVYGEEK